MKPFTILVSFFIILFFANCAHIPRANSEQAFRHTYTVSSNDLFEATLALLQSEGFNVGFADKQRGIIQTQPTALEPQTALALFDKPYDKCRSKAFSIRFIITPLSAQTSQMSVKLLSNEPSNGILEKTLIDKLGLKLGLDDNSIRYKKIDVTHLPTVNVLLKDHSTVEGYLLDEERAYLRLKLKSGGIMHIDRSDVEQYTLTSTSASSND